MKTVLEERVFGGLSRGVNAKNVPNDLERFDWCEQDLLRRIVAEMGDDAMVRLECDRDVEIEAARQLSQRLLSVLYEGRHITAPAICVLSESFEISRVPESDGPLSLTLDITLADGMREYVVAYVERLEKVLAEEERAIEEARRRGADLLAAANKDADMDALGTP